MTLAAFFPMLASVRGFLEQATTYARTLKGDGMVVDPDVVALYLTAKMSDWEPKIGRIPVMDPATRIAGARFIAGIAVNVVTAADAATRHRSHA